MNASQWREQPQNDRREPGAGIAPLHCSNRVIIDNQPLTPIGIGE